MPLEPYDRNGIFWARGRIEFNGAPITGYLRLSTGASTEGGARAWIAAETERAIRRHVAGDAPQGLSFEEAVLRYPAKPAEAKKLLRLLDHFAGRPVASITPRELRALGRELMPQAATDTWWREIVTPVRAVINNAHDDGLCPPMRVKGYSSRERLDQDRARGKVSRQEKRPGDRAWLAAFQAEADVYNAALAAFMFETGARVSQAVALRPRDLDLVEARVWLPESKGHPAQWVAISQAMRARLANLPPKRPRPRAGTGKMAPRVFGYASPTSMHARWRTICAAAGIPYLAPHAAGRHGFYTELRVRQGLDPITAAKAGRWADPVLPDRVYGHSDADERALREAIGTNPVHEGSQKPAKTRGSGRKSGSR